MSVTNGTNGVYHWSVEGDPITPAPLLSPVSCTTIISPDQAGKRRRLDCRHYDKCLTIAVEEKWESFSCRSCKAYTPKTRAELIRESSTLSAILDRSGPGK